MSVRVSVEQTMSCCHLWNSLSFSGIAEMSLTKSEMPRQLWTPQQIWAACHMMLTANRQDTGPVNTHCSLLEPPVDIRRTAGLVLCSVFQPLSLNIWSWSRVKVFWRQFTQIRRLWVKTVLYEDMWADNRECTAMCSAMLLPASPFQICTVETVGRGRGQQLQWGLVTGYEPRICLATASCCLHLELQLLQLGRSLNEIKASKKKNKLWSDKIIIVYSFVLNGGFNMDTGFNQVRTK